MTETDFKNLKPGDMIRRDNTDPSHVYTVTTAAPVLGIVKAVREVVADSATEWQLVKKGDV